MNFLFNHFADLVFYIFGIGIIGACVAVLVAKNTIYAALGLIGVFFNASMLLILMGAEFLGLILLLVYTGAIAILFLFGMMMASSLKDENFSLKSSEKVAIYGAGGVLAIQLCSLLLLKLDTFSQQFLHSQLVEALKVQALGEVLYTDYFLIVQMVGFVLFITMIGVVALLSHKRNFLPPPPTSNIKDPGPNHIVLHHIPLHRGTKENEDER